MGTIVTVEVVGDAPDETFEQAFAWFREVERLCSRFDPTSELRQLIARPREARPASDILYAALEFALAVAEDTDGAFDPTVGLRMEALGFDRDYRTGEVAGTGLEPDGPVSYRDIRLDPDRRTVTLLRPLGLDLGAVAKGLAIDLAARELAPCENFAIDAGGDLYVAGHNSRFEKWSVGIRHPRLDGELIESLSLSNVAVCTSGDYERKVSGGAGGHHILDPRTGRSAEAIASATVIAPTAIMADALATAAFVLGPDEGIRLLERQDVEGVLVSPSLDRFETPGMRQ